MFQGSVAAFLEKRIPSGKRSHSSWLEYSPFFNRKYIDSFKGSIFQPTLVYSVSPPGSSGAEWIRDATSLRIQKTPFGRYCLENGRYIREFPSA